jgi:hypothetical protein
MAPDYDLLLRLLKFGKFFSVNEALIKLRLHTKNRSLKKFNSLNQLDYAICANICHYIRRKTNSDPATDLNNNEWSIFLKKIAATLKKDKYYKYLVFKKKLKIKIKKMVLEKKTKSLFYLLFKEKLYFYFLIDYFRGHTISNKIKNYYLKYYKNYFYTNKILVTKNR